MSTSINKTKRISATKYEQRTNQATKSEQVREGSSNGLTSREGKSENEQTSNQLGKTKSSSKTTSNGRNQRNGISNATGQRTSRQESQSNGASSSSATTVGTSEETRESKTVRELTSRQIRTGGTTQKANIGCTISFSIPILGRVPTTSSCK